MGAEDQAAFPVVFGIGSPSAEGAPPKTSFIWERISGNREPMQKSTTTGDRDRFDQAVGKT